MSLWRHIGPRLAREVDGPYQRGQSRILFGAAAALAFLVLLTIIWMIAWKMPQTRTIELVVDGNSETIETKVAYVHELLAEQGIAITEHDWISVPPTDKLHQHDRIEIKYAVPVTIEVDAQSSQLTTTAMTVGQLIEQVGIELGEFDIVQPGKQEQLRPGVHVRISRVEKRLEHETEMIPFEIVTRQDPSLSKGKEKIEQEGEPGLVEYTYERVYADGELIEETLVDTKVQREAVSRIVAVGTRSEVTILSAASPDVQTVTKDGITFGVKKVIEATLTAYDSGQESTGKTEDHPQYGVTYTGTKVKEGRTASVDPDVIPLGWWIYIEGYGFRRAEDTGSGVKGNWVDIYFDSHEIAENFGKKKAAVYIIGPEHPSGE